MFVKLKVSDHAKIFSIINEAIPNISIQLRSLVINEIVVPLGHVNSNRVNEEFILCDVKNIDIPNKKIY